MYKIKLINYKPYEYELLQEKLNQLGQDGYKCEDLSLISVFKKVDHPIYYHFDFFKSHSRTRREKQIDKLNYYDIYLEKGYHNIYNKHGLCIFMGEKELKKDNKTHNREFLEQLDVIAYLSRFLSSIGISLLCIILFFAFSRINSFLSNGILFFYLGFVFAFIASIYRTFLNYQGMKKMKTSFDQRQYHIINKKTKTYRLIYGILALLSCLCIVGGLASDTLSAHEFTLQEHPVLTLSSLTNEETQEFTTSSQSSIMIPHYYSSLEIGKENSVLYIKEYQLASLKSANQLISDFQKNPNQLSCSRLEEKNNVLYGYVNDTLASFIIQKDKRVVVVSLSFAPSEKQIQTIIDYYK